ncbi:MAG: glycosyltransferase family 2 protein [Erythrobacter sp.]
MTTKALRLVTCIGVEHDLALLPHFVDHYRAVGVDPGHMIAILNSADENSAALERARRDCAEAGVAAEAWIAPYTSDTMWEKRREVQARTCAEADWVLSADVDELHEYPEPLAIFLDRCESMGADVIQGVFIDRVAHDGTLAPVAPEHSLSRQYELRADAMGIVGRKGRHHDRFGTVKVMAMRGHHRPDRGGHDVVDGKRARYLYRAPLGNFERIDEPSFRFAVPTRVNHYRWTQSLAGSLRQRLSTPGVSAAGEEYGGKQLAFLEQGERFDITALPTDDAAFPRPDWQKRLGTMRRKGAIMSAAYGLRRTLTGGRG